MVLAAPVLIATLLMVAFDRTLQTSFFLASARRQPLLIREPVLVLRPPGGLRARAARLRDHPRAPARVRAQAAVGLPAGRRRACWAWRCSRFFVWQHHLFVSGINSALRPFYMLSTEVISIPTGFIFLCGMATLWRARIRYTVPMLFCLALFFNFFIGGVSGFFLSDTPSDVDHPRQLLRHGALPLHDHGRPDLRVLRRDLLLDPEDDRAAVQRAPGEDPLLGDVHRLQLDFRAALRARPHGACRDESPPTPPTCSR